MQLEPIREDVEGGNDQDSRNSCMEGRIPFFLVPVFLLFLLCVTSPLARRQMSDATMFIFVYFAVDTGCLSDGRWR